MVLSATQHEIIAGMAILPFSVTERSVNLAFLLILIMRSICMENIITSNMIAEVRFYI